MRYFGTDGIRGEAGKKLTTELSLRLGKTLGAIIFDSYCKKKEYINKRPFVVIGKDPRISSYMITNALVAGLCERGVDASLLYVVPTPAVAYATREKEADLGIMVTASHNVFSDNGIKLFDKNGFKISSEFSDKIEYFLRNPEEINKLSFPKPNQIGKIISDIESRQKYIKYINNIGINLTGMHIAIDCANGSTSDFANKIFSNLNAKVSVMANDPNGININDKVGSTYVSNFVDFVLKTGADIGFAYDGDGDRVICVDEKGNIRDGDYILYICARYLKMKGFLNKDTVVCTIMANLGFHKSIEELGIKSILTDVGDRFIAESMIQGGYSLGGEQSGHIVFLEDSTTGDGLLTSVKLLKALKFLDLTLLQASDMMKKIPQLICNIKVPNKNIVCTNHVIIKEINKINSFLGEEGRVLVRPSGTEELIRIMVECYEPNRCKEILKDLLKIIEEEVKKEKVLKLNN